MKTRSMTPFWIIGAICAMTNFICGTFLGNGVKEVLFSIQSLGDITFAMIYELFINHIGYIITIIIFGVTQLVFSIIHLSLYSKNEFKNNDSKIIHALHELFFGQSLVGLLIVLHIDKKRKKNQIINENQTI